MVGVSSSLRTVNPLGLSTGGTSSSALGSSKPAQWLKSVFERLSPRPTPKVVKSQTNKSEVLLQRTGRQAAIDLRLLGKSPPQPRVTPQPGTQSGNEPTVRSPVLPVKDGPVQQLATLPHSGGVVTGTIVSPLLPEAPIRIATVPTPVTVVAPTVPTSAELKEAVKSLRLALVTNAVSLSELGELHAGLFASGKTPSKGTAAYVDAQRNAGVAVNAGLDTVTKLVRAAAKDPSLVTEVATLKRLQTELARQAVLVQQPSLDIDIPRGDGVKGLRAEVQLIEMMVDDFVGGQATVELIHNLDFHSPEVLTGREVTLSELRDLVKGLANELELSGSDADQTSVQHLRQVAAALDVRLEVGAAAVDLAALKTEHPTLDVSALTRQFRLALPPIDWHGNIGDPGKLRIASGAIGAFASLVRGGEVPDILIGTNGDLNASLLAVKVGKAKDQAVETLQSKVGDRPLTQSEIDGAKLKGEKIATLRHELTLSNRTLEAHLKTDRRVWYKPSTWGDTGRVFGEGASGVRKDQQFLKALTKLGGKEAGQDVLLLIARVSVLEAETVRLEKTELGLHESFDLSGLQKAEGSDPLAYLGIDNADLAKVGIKGEARETLVGALKDVVGTGLVNVEQVDKVVSQLNSAREKVLRNTMVQGTITDFAKTSVQATAKSLLSDVLIDAYLQSGKPIDGDTIQGLSVKTPEVDRFFKMMGMGLEAATFGDLREEMLKSSDDYRETEIGIAGLAERRQAHDAKLGRMQEAIGNAKADGLSKSDVAMLKTTVKALREEIAAIDKDITLHAKILDSLSQSRETVLGPILQEAKTMIRAAALATLPAQKLELAFKDGRLDSQLQPMAQRKEIESMLAGWGFDIDAFAPEIDSVLYGTLGADDLSTWRSEATFSSRFQEIARQGTEPGFFSVDQVLRRQDMDSQARSALKSLVEGMVVDDKISFKAGQRITLDSLNIPVEPSGIVSLRAKLSGSFLDQLGLELGSDGFKLHVRSGADVKGGLDVVAGKSLGVLAGKAKLEAGVGVEASGGKLSGFTLKIPNTETGRQKLAALVMKMAENKPIEASDMLFVGDIAESSETNLKGGVLAKAKAQLEGKVPVVDISGGIQAEASTGLSLGKKWGVSANHKASMVSGEVEIAGTVTIGASAYVKVQTAANLAQGELFKATGVQSAATDHFGKGSDGKTKYDISSPQQQIDLIGVTTTFTSSYINKWKHERDENGRYTKAEIVRQTNINNSALGAVTLVATKGLKTRLSSDDPKDDEIQKKFGSLTALMGTNDVLSITYACGKDQLARANHLLDEADQLRKAGKDKEADKLERLAESIVSEPENHAPTKVALIKVETDKREIGNLNMRFVKWDVVSDSKFEHPTATITL